MDMAAFQRYLKKGGRSASAEKRCVQTVHHFDDFLRENYSGVNLAEAGPAELEAYVTWIEEQTEGSVKTALWGLRYWFQFVDNPEMAELAGRLRAARISRKSFPIKDFLWVDQEAVAALAEVGIQKDDQMLVAAARPVQREELARRTGLDPETILELAQLCDLARIPGMKGVRARLYHAAGVRDIPQLAAWEPEPLRLMVAAYVETSGFPGIPPLPKEVASGVAKARKLPPAILYD